MIPSSLAVGNTLTLIDAQHGNADDNGTMQWQPMTGHRGLNKPRKVMAHRSKYAELGEEKSMLTYPKKGEFTETDDTLVLTLIDKGGAGMRDVGTKLTYKVEKV